MKKIRFLVGLSVVFALLPFVIGCSPNVSLKGKVTFSDDASPVTMGSLYFVSGPHTSRAQLKTDGTFIVGSLKERDGLPPGRYLVSLQDTSPIIGTKENGDPIYKRLVDAKYEDEQTSGLVIEVPAPKGRYELTVDRYVPNKAQ